MNAFVVLVVYCAVDRVFPRCVSRRTPLAGDGRLLQFGSPLHLFHTACC